MKMTGFITLMVRSLEIQIETKNWHIIISPNKGKSFPRDITKYHQNEVAIEDIKKFVPNCLRLKWETINGDNFLFKFECKTTDSDFTISLVNINDEQLTPEKVIKEFQNMML
ncbi:MAG: hypothetical protein WC799_12645 [Desulfobacteraceae bacterium]|jgi:hypothetical protein